MRLGLCCLFHREDIRFKSRQAGYIAGYAREEQLKLLSATVAHNAASLLRAMQYCAQHGIGCFRINSGILPLKSHPHLHYGLSALPDYERISELFEACRVYGRSRNIRLTFHPDQFTLLSSPRDSVTLQSLEELKYHAEIATLVGADVITLHGGGAYGDKCAALARLEKNIAGLPENIRMRLALENDDRVYSPEDLLPVCLRTGVPFVYDVHHHRCLADGLTIEEATEQAISSWAREPLFHISSPRNGWLTKDVRPHHDFINPEDIPSGWKDLEITVEVEAKAKELAIARLQQALDQTGRDYQIPVG